MSIRNDVEVIDNNTSHKDSLHNNGIMDKKNQHNEKASNNDLQTNDKTVISNNPLKSINANASTINQSNNKTLTKQNSTTSNKVKKTSSTLLAEKAFQHLYHKGHLPTNLCYDSLINEKQSKRNISRGQSKDKEHSNIIISNFLERTHLYSTQKQMNFLKNNQSNLYYQTLNNNKSPQNKKIRTQEQFLQDQSLFTENKKRRIEEKRKTLKEKSDSESQEKPTINNKSRKIYEHIATPKEIHIRLYEDVQIRAISKENLKRKVNEQTSKKDKHQRKKSQSEIDVSSNKMYLSGVEQLKKKNQIPLQDKQTKVKVIPSRNYNSCQSSLTITKSKNTILTTSTEVLNTKYFQDAKVKNKMILIKKLDQEIDVAFENIININSKDKDKDLIDNRLLKYNHYCDLLFYLGFLQYDYMKFIDYIRTNTLSMHDIEDLTLIDYDTLSIDNIKLNDIIIRHSLSSKEVTKDNIVKEFTLIKKSWELLSNKQETIPLNIVKLFLLCIIGSYSGEKSAEQPRTSSCTSITKTEKSHESSHYIHKHIIQNQPELKYTPEQAKVIYKTYNKFSINRIQFNNKFTQTKKAKKLFTHSSNPELTFKPTITEIYRTTEPHHKMKLEESYDIIQRRKKNEIERLQKEKELNEMKPCTFHPNSRTRSKRRSFDVSNRLYSYTKSSKKNTTTNIVTNNNTEYTFTPHLNEPISDVLFSQESIKNDPIVSIKIEQYEKARIEKKLIDYVSKKGTIGLSQMKTSDDLLKEFRKEETIPSFRFDLEKKHNKDTFDSFNKKHGRGNSMQNQQPLFTIEVKIQKRVELLDYYQNDNPSIITQKFCKKHNLGSSSYDKILSVIEEKLQSNDE